MYPNLIICLVFVLLLWGLSMDSMAGKADDELAEVLDLYADEDESAKICELPGAFNTD